MKREQLIKDLKKELAKKNKLVREIEVAKMNPKKTSNKPIPEI